MPGISNDKPTPKSPPRQERTVQLNANATIEHLSKVTLALISPPAPNETKGEFTFIYGIGTQGMTAFEQALHGKQPGDGISRHVDGDNLLAEFEHLAGPLINAVGQPPPFELEIVIRSVVKATDLEVVQALAHKNDAGGCAGGCGCGCS